MPHRFRLFEAALPLLLAALLLMVTVLVGSTRFYWPLVVGALVAALIARRAGYTAKELAEGAYSGMKSTLIALSILVLIGGLIGVWKAAGTVPAMIYYGLGVATPQYLVPAAFLLSLATSMMLGTSIGTLSTLGVAIIGVAHGVGAPLPIVAGALVSGAMFGDRSSPLSGSLALNVSMTRTELRPVLTALLPTGLLAAGLSLAGYLYLGLISPPVRESSGVALRQALEMHFVISPWLLLPPLLVLALAFLRVPVRWAIVTGMAAGALLAGLYGQAGLVSVAAAGLFGFNPNTGDPALDRILSGGGILPMTEMLVLILVAGGFNGIMERTGMMSLVISKLVEGIRRPVVLVASTMVISVSVALIAANQALSIIVPGRMLRPTYDRAGLSPNILSRSLADSGTVLTGVIPWNMVGILSAASLGVPVRAFAPFALLVWLLPLVSLAKTAAEERSATTRGAGVLERA